MEQKANITIDKEHITVERTQTACGREIRVISVFPRHGSETVEDKLKALAELDFRQEKLCGGVGGDFHLHGDEMVQALPRKAHLAVGGGAQGGSLRDAMNQLWLQRNGAVARFSRADTHQLLQQPVAHGAKGIVVKAVHAAFVKAAVGADAVPVVQI